MSMLCTACGLEIPLGHDSIFISHGSIEESQKSGRPYHNGHEEDPIHSDVSCYLQYLALRTNSSADQLIDTAVELCRKSIEPDLRVEITDEVREKFRDEIQEEVVDHLGRHCAVCNEEMDNFHDAIDRDTDPPPQLPQHQPYMAYGQPIPIPGR